MNIRGIKVCLLPVHRKFTAIAALDKLGPSFTFKTQASYSGQLQGSTLQGNLYLTSNGDPTLGSWRYEGYKPENFKAKLLAAVQDKGIKTIEGDLILDDSYFDLQTTPEAGHGMIWAIITVQAYGE
jgi:D-alanyl-D-alanine carboxypeptidase/D-alanyl-D-alanine-endopeptidase (penicillin-binding protein 4)